MTPTEIETLKSKLLVRTAGVAIQFTTAIEINSSKNNGNTGTLIFACKATWDFSGLTGGVFENCYNVSGVLLSSDNFLIINIFWVVDDILDIRIYSVTQNCKVTDNKKQLLARSVRGKLSYINESKNISEIY